MNNCFENFLRFFGENKTAIEGSETVSNFRNSFSGKEFADGVFKVFKKDDITKWNAATLEMFPDFKIDFILFGYDWLGRFYATNKLENIIYVFDPSTNEVLELEDRFSNFINETLTKNANDILAVKLYKKWLRKYAKPSYTSCIGYKVPLFLGGKDNMSNYEESDMEVYWSISAQIISQIKNQADGTIIDSLSIK